MGVTFGLGVDAFNQRWFARVVKPGMTVYDIGANRGQMTLHFARFVGPSGMVVAFEPVKQLFDNLLFNVRLNNLSNVQAHCVGVVKLNGIADFGFDENRPTTGKIIDCEPSYNDHERKTCFIETVTLDDLCRRGFPISHILKIDVEGGARLVLQGAIAMLEQHRPSVYIELQGPEERQAVNDYLIYQGCKAETLGGENVGDSTVVWRDPLWCQPRGK